jgi:hypothetical protein
MRQPLLVMMLMVSVLCGNTASCDKSNTNINPDPIIGNNDNDMSSNKITIKINSKIFTATLLDNNSAKAFKQILPITVRMTDLNDNEKKYDLADNLPAKPSKPGSIKKGDLMLYGSRTLVLFYQSFSTVYSYTKLGAVDDVSGFASALGSGSATVTFEIK